MYKKFVFLIAFLAFLPALVQSAPLSEPASLRETLSLDAVSYIRIPSPWGMFSAPKGNVLNGVLESEQQSQQIKQLEASFYQNVLKKGEAFIHPALTLFFHHLRSPVEAVVLLPKGASPLFANVLVSAKLNFTSVEEFKGFLKELVAKTPPLSIVSEVSADGYGTLMAGVPVFLHYDVNTYRLSLMGGLAANQAVFKQALSQKTPVKQHPMYELENRIDASRQGFFKWVNLQKILPLLLQMGMPPPEVAEKWQKWGLMSVRGVALGLGIRDGKGRLSLVIDAPKAGYREFFPAISNNFSLTASGKPGVVFSVSLPAFELLKGFEQVLLKELKPEDLLFYQNLKEAFKTELGFSIEDVLQAFGPEALFFSDEIGEFAAVKIGNKNLVQKILAALVKKYGFPYETRQRDGKEYHHMATPTLSTEDLPVPESQAGAFWVELALKFNSHSYWVEEEGYLIFANVPQVLFDRQKHKARVHIQQWLKQEQRQDIQSSLFVASTSISNIPRRLYYAYLQMLNGLADVASTKVDLFTLPTALELNLPKSGTYGMHLDLSDSQLALELVFENNPLEFMLAPSAMTTVVVGVLAGVATYAYADYLKKAEGAQAEAMVSESERVAEAVALLEEFKAPAATFFAIFNRFPEAEEVKEIWEISGGEDFEIRLLDSKDGYSAGFKDSAISGKVIIRYDAKSDSWTCTHDGLSEESLPSHCK